MATVSADSVNSSGYCVCRFYIVIYITTKYFVFFVVKVLKSDVETIHICAFSCITLFLFLLIGREQRKRDTNVNHILY